jgi:hypothetical protein
MPEPVDEYLAHYGVKGMRWGKRSASSSDSSGTPKKSRKELRVLDKAERARKNKEQDSKIEDARNNLHKEAQAYTTAKKKYDVDRKVIGKEAAEKALIDANDKYVSSFNTAMMSTTKERHKQMIIAAGLTTMTVVLAGVNGAMATR